MKKFLSLISILYCSYSFANDAYLGSIGGNVFPVFNQDSIRMAKENIYILMGKDSCFVTCKFWFVNQTNKNISLLMGFPDYIANPANASQSIRTFTCKVNGENQDVDKFIQQISIENEPSIEWYDKWFCWDVGFKPFDTIIVENTYWGYYGGSLGGTFSFDYLIGTAKTWNGSIGEGRIVFNYSDLISDLFIDTSYYQSDKFLSKGLIRNIFVDSIVYSYRNFVPEWDQRLRVEFFSYWAFPYGMVEFPLRASYTINRSKEQYRLMRNEIYARHGYMFRDQQLQDYFNKKAWYRKDPDFDLKELNDYELFFIGFLHELEKERK